MKLAARPALTTDQLLERIDGVGLSRLATDIVEQSAPAMQLVPGTDSDASFFGDLESLPAGWEPPAIASGPLACILSVRLPDIADAAVSNKLPADGWLLFFVALSDELAQGEGIPFNEGAARVLHLPEGEVAPRREPPVGEFQRVTFEPIVTVPDPDIAGQLWNLSPQEREAYETLYGPQAGVSPGPPPHAVHYMFGHQSPVYSSGMPPKGQPTETLLLQLQLYEATGADILSRPLLLFMVEKDKPLTTLDVHVQS